MKEMVLTQSRQYYSTNRTFHTAGSRRKQQTAFGSKKDGGAAFIHFTSVSALPTLLKRSTAWQSHAAQSKGGGSGGWDVPALSVIGAVRLLPQHVCTSKSTELLR